MLLAAMFLVATDSIAKYLGQRYPAPQLLWARYGVHMLIMIACVVAMGHSGRRLLVSVAPRGQFLRGLLLFGATSFAYLAVRELPLVQVYVVNFSSPLLVTLLAIPLLGENVGWRRALAVCVGFAGVLITLGPDRITTDATLLLPTAMALCFALYQVATRRYGCDDPALTSLIYTAAAGAVVSTLVLPFFWMPIAADDAWLFVVLGALGAAGHLSLIVAMRLAEGGLPCLALPLFAAHLGERRRHRAIWRLSNGCNLLRRRVCDHGGNLHCPSRGAPRGRRLMGGELLPLNNSYRERTGDAGTRSHHRGRSSVRG